MSSAKAGSPVLRYGDLDHGHLTKHLLILARRVGVDHVTMRGLAAEAGTAASSVYYHVKDKGQLFDLLIDAIMENIEAPKAGDWEERLIALYTSAWTNLVSVPGVASLLHQRPMTPATRELDRLGRKILSESTIPKSEIDAAHAVLYINLLGSVEFEHRLRTGTDWQSTGSHATGSVFAYGLRVLLRGMTTAPEPNGRAPGKRTLRSSKKGSPDE